MDEATSVDGPKKLTAQEIDFRVSLDENGSVSVALEVNSDWHTDYMTAGLSDGKSEEDCRAEIRAMIQQVIGEPGFQYPPVEQIFHVANQLQSQEVGTSAVLFGS
mmetsp:Transcript_105472/g.183451  ORF Transcript_105472/g.183451 Transcript_105472/m.183451 type:complete len:105 (-) Transcript_105472:136-450(-)